MISNKRLFNVIWALCGFALIEAIIIINLMISKPETIIEEKIVEIEVEKEVEKIVEVEVEKIVEVEVEKKTEDAVSNKKTTSESTSNTKPAPKPTEPAAKEPAPASTEIEYKDGQTYNISEADREMLARLVYLEANTESLECQKAIVSVIINRWQSGYWGNTLNAVVYAPSQFTPASKIPYTTPTATNYQAVDEVLKNGCTVPQYVMYFRTNYHFNWKGYSPYTKIDDVCFGYLNKDKK